MHLSAHQRKQLQSALIGAFPSTTSLEQMLNHQLDKNLREIVGEGSLQHIVFNLIQAADSQGWIANLICEACNYNSGNFKLQTVIQNLIIKSSSTIFSRIQESLEEYGYSDLDELGTGASGVTYRAIKGNDQKYIVIKTIKIDLLHQIIKSDNQELKEFSQAITSFKKEAEILSNFKHRHIVSYYDYLTIPFKFLITNPHKKLNNNSYLVYDFELLFLVMKYIEGQNLEQILSKRDSPLQETEALSYIQQISEVLTQIHNKGVLHRDIKPQNIIVRETTNNAVLIDFGIAREFNPIITQTLTLGFTQGYAPPEQLESRAKWGNYTDVYGLAATLYYLLTKTDPPHAMLRKSNSSSFVEPKKINSNISDTVNEAILWGMELEFSKRPQTVQQWLARLLPPVCALNATTYYNRGNACYHKKDYERAIADYNQAIKLDPNYVQAYYNRGNAYKDLKDYERAIADYNQALRLNPSEVKAYVNRGNVRVLLAEYSSAPDKDYEQAIADFNSALRINPNDVEAYVGRGIVRSQTAKYSGDSQQEYKKAIEDFNQALNVNPSRAEAFFQRGLARYEIAQYSSGFEKEYKQAINDFDQALHLDSKLAKAYLKRGIARYELAQYGGHESKQDYAKAIEDLKTFAKISLAQNNIDDYQIALAVLNHLLICPP